jgi:hypothetical protein
MLSALSCRIQLVSIVTGVGMSRNEERAPSKTQKRRRGILFPDGNEHGSFGPLFGFGLSRQKLAAYEGTFVFPSFGLS